MSPIATSTGAEAPPDERLAAIFEELAELTGQRNAIDATIVDLVAEIDHDGIWGATGARLLTALVAWKTGMSPSNAETITTVAPAAMPSAACTPTTSSTGKTVVRPN